MERFTIGERRSQSRPYFIIASWVSCTGIVTIKRLRHYFQYAFEKNTTLFK